LIAAVGRGILGRPLVPVPPSKALVMPTFPFPFPVRRRSPHGFPTTPILAALAAVLSCTVVRADEVVPPERPNIVYIMADDND
jgi:hypothetical protein